jgi:hypothetical protein
MADQRQALETLYRAPLAKFVAERKRLAAALRSAGDEEAAKELAGRRRPTASAWAVNQLYWHARRAFEALLAAAGRIRKGDLRETQAYRDALADLQKRAADVLRDAGHAPTPAIMRRVAGTLAAVAATGGFDPDPPGALTADREPPGFEVLGDAPMKSRAARPNAAAMARNAAVRNAGAERERVAAARAEGRARARAEAKRKAERGRLETALHRARATLETRERESSRLQKQLRAAEEDVREGQDAVRRLERSLAALREGE